MVKHFAIDEEHSFVQYSLTMTEEAFNVMTGEGAGAPMVEPGKNKILICAYDISGSMSGSPT